MICSDSAPHSAALTVGLCQFVKPRRCRHPGHGVQDATTPRPRLPHAHGLHTVPRMTDVIPHKKTLTKVKTYYDRSPSMWTPLHCLCDVKVYNHDVPRAAVSVMRAMDDDNMLALTPKLSSASFVIMNYELQPTLGQG